jgi:DNA modification methylase
MSFRQAPLLSDDAARSEKHDGAIVSLESLLRSDLDFHGDESNYATHNFHSFPAKFPPQLPAKFISGLTDPGDVVLDPMLGSGTTLVEAYLSNRQGIGFDIDPLALRIAKVKTTPLKKALVAQTAQFVVKQARLKLETGRAELDESLATRWTGKTKDFVDYWFAKETQRELLALIQGIETIEDAGLRTFLEVTFSAVIITKNGGVSLALDLAHTRPHRAKVIYGSNGTLVLNEGIREDQPQGRLQILTKRLRPAVDEFERRAMRNVASLPTPDESHHAASVQMGDAQNLPLEDKSVDLIVTSPPYASNAIDYMRAHKFSLVWFKETVETLGQKRGEYIGGESTTDFKFEPLPPKTERLVLEIAQKDAHKGNALRRYYSEMTCVLSEMYRVLRSGKSAIVVVGSSVMRGRNTETHLCLKEIGETFGLQVPLVGVRNLDRNRRMLPAGMSIDRESQIQQRMHEEYVIGFQKL